jgi:hypothetical protein
MKPDDILAGLPGEAIMRRGLADWRAGRSTLASCLVAIGAPRLRSAGLLVGRSRFPPDEAEHRLYEFLCEQRGDAYSRYNALLRELISFEQSLDQRVRRLSKAERPR